MRPFYILLDSGSSSRTTPAAPGVINPRLTCQGATIQHKSKYPMGDPKDICSKLPGLKQEMRPPVLHIRYTMSGEAAV